MQISSVWDDICMAHGQTDSITGTSMRTPTTVANAAPEPGPKSAMADATANSGKLLAPISAPGAARVRNLEQAHQTVRQRGIEINLREDRHRDQEQAQQILFDIQMKQAVYSI